MWRVCVCVYKRVRISIRESLSRVWGMKKDGGRRVSGNRVAATLWMAHLELRDNIDRHYSYDSFEYPVLCHTTLTPTVTPCHAIKNDQRTAREHYSNISLHPKNYVITIVVVIIIFERIILFKKIVGTISTFIYFFNYIIMFF